MASESSYLPLIGITCGDAAGIGPEVIAKALSSASLPKAKYIIYSRQFVFEDAIHRYRSPIRYAVITTLDESFNRDGNVFILNPLDTQQPDINFGTCSPILADDAMRLVKKATEDAVLKRIDAFVTGPINKEGIKKAGYSVSGHTEFIAGIAGSEKYAMMFAGGNLKVALVTIHIPLFKVPESISRKNVFEKLLILDRALRDLFGIEHPVIAVCGLNPHAGENGIIGKEEIDAIIPAIDDALERGIKATGPFPADTIFPKHISGAYDAVLAMYHDQGLIPVKMTAFGKSVNITIGLSFIRTSPDHGTAYDIAGKGIADPGSMSEAIRLAVELAIRKHKLSGTT